MNIASVLLWIRIFLGEVAIPLYYMKPISLKLSESINIKSVRDFNIELITLKVRALYI